MSREGRGALEAEELEGRTAWWCRLAMAREGWASKTRLSDSGWGGTGERFGFSVSFERWDWHGRRIDRLSFGASAGENPAVEAMSQAVRRAARLALRAWREFPHAVPTTDRGGELAEDKARSAHYAPSSFPGDWLPTERLEEATGLADLEQESDLEGRLALAARRVWTEDELHYMGWNPDRTRDFRRWGWTLEASPALWLGERAMPYRFTFSTDNLLHSLADGLVRHADREIVQQEARGRWLPGMQSVAEAVIAEEMRERAKEERWLLEGVAEAPEVAAARRARWERSRTLKARLRMPESPE